MSKTTETTAPKTEPAAVRSTVDLAWLKAWQVLLVETFFTAIRSLWNHRIRSLITAVGIIVGCMTYTAISAMLRGKLENDLGEMRRLGSTFVSIRMVERAGKGERLNEDHGTELFGQIPQFKAYSPIYAAETDVTTNLSSAFADVVGTWASVREIIDLNVVQGRFFTESEVLRAVDVCVLGAGVAERLRVRVSPGDTPVVTFFGQPLRVVGVLEKRPGTMPGCGEFDECAILPASTLRELKPDSPMALLAFKARDEDEVPSIAVAARFWTRKLVGLTPDSADTFQVVTASDLRRRIKKELENGAAVSTGVLIMTLLVAGVGVMNTMLLTVAERTPEIGLRKAVGAQSNQILVQFIVESLCLCGGGGFLGTMIGVVIARTMGHIFVGGVTPVFAPSMALTSLGFALLTGFLFGFAPAYRASRLDPIEALRRD
jgi:putative ABC transport system permease protein